MAKDDKDKYKEGVDFEWVNSNARTKDGGYVKTRRFFTKAEKAEKANPKKPATSESKPKAAPAAKPKPAGGARPTVGAAGGMPAAKPKPAGGARPTVGAAGGMPAAKPKPAAGGARPTVGPASGLPAKPKAEKRVPGRALWLGITGGGNPKNYLDGRKKK